ncbi:MAG: endo-1,3-1,4-beta glucanase-related protein [Armatimonadota bacterium]|nr:MAG: endo-1,3-1,4-beta glucanase-related protein [Armatimonadota bacterium]
MWWRRTVALLLAVAVAGMCLAQQKPAKPPRGAIVLFDGKDLSQWVSRDGKSPARWEITPDGAMQVKAGTGDIMTRDEFGSFQLHIEFNIPPMPQASGQGRGNSGVYLHGLYELQVLDSYQNETYAKGGCAAIYGIKDPDKNAAKPPGQWQTYDITFIAPRFDSEGKVIAKPRVTVRWNGVLVHDNVEIPHITAGGIDNKMRQKGPILLQDHGNPVQYRNIWIRPLKD